MTKSEFASSPRAPKSLDLIVLIGIISPNKLQYYKDFSSSVCSKLCRIFQDSQHIFSLKNTQGVAKDSPHNHTGESSAGCNSSNTSDHHTRYHLLLVIFYFLTEHRKVLIQPVINPSIKPSSKQNLYMERGEPESLAQPKAFCSVADFCAVDVIARRGGQVC